MKRAVAMVLALTLSGGCFPKNARNRTIAEIIEGGVAVSGVVVEGLVNTGADCDTSVAAPGEPPMQCKDNASLGGGIGVALILAGVVGFIATISTAEDDNDDKPKPIEIKATPEPVPVVVTPPPVVAPTPPPEPTPPAPTPVPPPPAN